MREVLLTAICTGDEMAYLKCVVGTTTIASTS